MNRAHLVLALAVSALATSGCQQIAGYDDFDFTTAAGGSGGSSGTSGGSGSSGSSGDPGKACTTDGECGSQICLLGYCRTPCNGDTTCDKSSICLGTPDRGGCRLTGDVEATCAGTCAGNTALSCGLDDSCRTSCNAQNSCPFNGQVCIGGTCVSQTESTWANRWSSCLEALKSGFPAKSGPYSEDGLSGFYCVGSTIHTCNVDGAGDQAHATCDTPEICGKAASAGQITCTESACNEGPYRCQGTTLQQCNAGKTAYENVPGDSDCKTEPLCNVSKDKANGKCATPVCGEGSSQPAGKCVDGDVLACGTGQQNYDTIKCSDLQKCNPTTRTCTTFAIDEHEVTRAEYQAFRDTHPTMPAQPAEACKWNTTYEPSASCLQLAEATDCHTVTAAMCTPYPFLCDADKKPLPCDQYPQPCVDWCDAHDYCEAQGKHLCGKLGDQATMVPAAKSSDPGQSAWMNACSSGGENEWVFGGSFKAEACDTKTNWSQAARSAPVKSFPACVAAAPGYAAVHDLTGSLAEWENSCESAPTPDVAQETVKCHVRGGFFDSTQVSAACKVDVVQARQDVSHTVGFRCCQD